MANKYISWGDSITFVLETILSSEKILGCLQGRKSITVPSLKWLLSQYGHCSFSRNHLLTSLQALQIQRTGVCDVAGRKFSGVTKPLPWQFSLHLGSVFDVHKDQKNYLSTVWHFCFRVSMVETDALKRGLLKDYNNKNEIRDQLSIAIHVFKECVLKFILIK